MEISKFILLNTHKSGTRLLFQALGDNSQIQRHVFDLTIILEWFVLDRRHSSFYKYRTTSLKRRIDYIFRKRQLIDNFLRELYTPDNGVKAVGIRLLYEQAAKHPEILEWAVENDVGIIHLIRENSLKAIVSNEATLKRGLLHSTGRARPLTTLHISPARLKRQLTILTQQIEQYRAGLQHARYLEVSYEALVTNPEFEASRLLAFLNLEPRAFKVVNSKGINPVSLESMIENYQEVKQSLQGTAFEEFLN